MKDVDKRNISVNFVSDYAIHWGIITFTSKIDLDLIYKVTKVTERSTLNSMPTEAEG